MIESAPDLRIPTSNTIVQVSIIDTTSFVGMIPTEVFMEGKIPGFDYLHAPAYSFLIEHPSGRKALFDLGVRKDWQAQVGT